MRALLAHPWTARIGPPVLAVACAALLGAALVAALGQNPFGLAGRVWGEATRYHGLRDDAAYVIAYATPLIFTGLGVAIAFRAGMFNIGGQGQVMIGGILCGFVGWKLAAWPAWALVPACFAAAAAGGAAWASIAGALRAWRGSHEVIVTIMLNVLAVALTETLAGGRWKSGAGMMSQLPDVGPGARLPRLGAWPEGSTSVVPVLGIPVFPAHVPANAAIFLALACCVAAWAWLWRTTRGFELRATGLGPEAARAAGIPPRTTLLIAMALSGALAGLAATDLVMGQKGTWRQDDGLAFAGQAFIGIAVALMGQNHPAGIVPAALLFGALQRLAFLLSGVPKDLVFILQAAVILFVVCGNEIFRRALSRRRAA
ncbi:MAG: ABC transporter permease [Candidatus Brocadiae bacterium]|nr:ABC transporter permease [Candidatus Brocadiia bacterium]